MQITIDGRYTHLRMVFLRFRRGTSRSSEAAPLHRRDHIFFDEDAILVDGKVQSMKDDPKLQEMKTAKKQNSDLIFFQFPARPNAVVDAGPHKIRFEGGKVGIDPEAAELLKRHVFYRQGKIQEIEVT